MPDQSSILSTAQNIATAINTLAQTIFNIQGAQSYEAISAATLVQSVPGRLAMVSVTTAGSANGTVYDSNSTGVTTAPIYAIPNTIGVVFVNLPVNSGILVVPGTSQVVTVSYSATP